MREQWDKFWARNRSSRFSKISWSKRRIISVLESYIKKPGLRVLDAGCGSGFFSKYLSERGCRVWACDYSAEAIYVTKQTTENRCEKYLEMDLLDKHLPIEYTHFFDLVFNDGLFEHFNLPQQQQLIQNFLMLKKKEGIIATFVPNKYSWWTIVRPLFMLGIDEKPFTMKGLKLLHSPLEIIECGGINMLPVKYSPDNFLSDKFGMLIYVVAR